MTELYNIEHIQRPMIKEEKVFHSIDNLVKYLKEEYCSVENKKIIEPFREYDTIGEFIEVQLKQEDQNFFKRYGPVMHDMMDASSVVTVKIPFNNYNNEDRWTGSSVEQFFVDRNECMVNL